MKRIEEIQKEIWNIWQILIEAKSCYEFSYYLYRPNTNDEAHYINISQHFKYLRIILWKMAIIELSKLYAQKESRDRFNLNHFISKLKSDGHFGNMGIDNFTIEEWEKMITENQITIGKVLKLRDNMPILTQIRKIT